MRRRSHLSPNTRSGKKTQYQMKRGRPETKTRPFNLRKSASKEWLQDKILLATLCYSAILRAGEAKEATKIKEVVV